MAMPAAAATTRLTTTQVQGPPAPSSASLVSGIADVPDATSSVESVPDVAVTDVAAVLVSTTSTLTGTELAVVGGAAAGTSTVAWAVAGGKDDETVNVHVPGALTGTSA